MNYVKFIFAAFVLLFALYYFYEGYLQIRNRAQNDEASRVVALQQETIAREGWLTSLPDALAESARQKKPLLIDFWASWCGPCRMVSPLVDQIANENQDVKVGKVDIDAQPELAGAFRVMSIPTLMVFKDGKLAKSVVGARPKAAILAMLD
jgi:thioredoxin 1